MQYGDPILELKIDKRSLIFVKTTSINFKLVQLLKYNDPPDITDPENIAKLSLVKYTELNAPDIEEIQYIATNLCYKLYGRMPIIFDYYNQKQYVNTTCIPPVWTESKLDVKAFDNSDFNKLLKDDHVKRMNASKNESIKPTTDYLKIAKEINNFNTFKNTPEYNIQSERAAEYKKQAHSGNIINYEQFMGGANRSPKNTKGSKWVSTGKKITIKDGSKRALYNNINKPNDLRIRRMVTRAGKTVATYVKP